MAIASLGSEPAAEPGSDNRVALRILQVGVVGVVLAALPYPLFDLERHAVPKELVAELTGFGAAIYGLVRAKKLQITAADALLAVFLAVSLVSAILAENHWLAFRAFGLSLSGALVFWSARTVAPSSREALVRTLAAAVALAAGTALLQAYGVELSVMAERRAPGGTFGNRNFMAHFVALGAPVLALAGLEARRRWEGFLWQAGVALAGAALVLSRSRAAWLAFTIGLASFAIEGLWAGGLWKNQVARSRVIALALAAGIAAGIALLLPNHLEWRSTSPYLDSMRGLADYREGSGRGRLVQYRNTLRMATDHPVAGVGAGNWAVEYPKYTFPGDPAFDPDDFIPTNPWPSSDWVALLAERGPLALVAVLILGGALAVGAWRRWRQGSHTTEGLQALVALITLLVLACVSAFDAVLLLPAPTVFIAALLGALIRPPRRSLFTIQLSDMRRARLAGAVALLGTLLTIQSIGQIAAIAVFSGGRGPATLEWAGRLDPGNYRIQMLLAYEWRNRGHCDRARPHAEAARRLYPNHPAPRQLLAACRKRRQATAP
jgi:O-antigen ligase